MKRPRYEKAILFLGEKSAPNIKSIDFSKEPEVTKPPMTKEEYNQKVADALLTLLLMPKRRTNLNRIKLKNEEQYNNY